jgi:hypothetical protein
MCACAEAPSLEAPALAAHVRGASVTGARAIGSIAKNTYSPDWNETFALEFVEAPPGDLLIILKDWSLSPSL